jgi:histidinol-phosphate aminotransferase
VTGRRTGTSASRRAPIVEWPLRLDLLVNPYGPSIRVQEALAAASDLHLPTGCRESTLRRSLAEKVGLSAESLTLTAGTNEALTALLNWRRTSGPVVLFPPTDPTIAQQAKLLGIEQINVPRSYRFGVEIDPDADWPAPSGATAYVMSPNDPTGTVLSAQDAVRLLRRCAFVVVDERHGDYGARSLAPLVREFDNVIVLRSFETWAGLTGFPFAYLIAPPSIASQISGYRPRTDLPAATVIAAEATIADYAYVQASAHRVREEKSRLYRQLRKLNMVRPLPSWANFLLARVERGDPILFEHELAERGIAVHRPLQPELAEYLRISAIGPESTLELKRALIDIATTL